MDQNQFNLLIKSWTHLSVPVAVLIASVLGSTHCILMCSPIAIMIKNQKGYLSLYHFGRLLSYIVLGSLGGFIGAKFINDNSSLISLISITIISTFFVFSGLRLLKLKPIHFKINKTLLLSFQKPMRWSMKQNSVIKSVSIGIINGFIPCGWVYIFLIGAIATQNPVEGAVLISLFWVGTLPALSFFSVITNSLLKKLPFNLTKAAGLILVVAGIITMFLHVYTNVDHSSNHSRHNAFNIERKDVTFINDF